MPIFLYSVGEGKLIPYKANDEEIDKLLSQMPGSIRTRHRNPLNTLRETTRQSTNRIFAEASY